MTAASQHRICVLPPAIGARVDDLRKGRSVVIERGHTLFLGWSDKLLPCIRACCVLCHYCGTP